MNPSLRIAAVAAFLVLAPLTASAQAVTTHSNASPQSGIYLFNTDYENYPETESQIWGNFGSIIVADIQGHGGSAYTSTQIENSGIAASSALGPATLNRVCYDADTSYGPGASARASNFDHEGYASCNNNTIVYFNGTTWTRTGACSSNSHLDSVSCTSYALPQQTLTANDYSITAGQSVKLTWNDNVARDKIWYPNNAPGISGYYTPNPQTSCTTSGFTIPDSGNVKAVCPNWNSYTSGSGCQQASADVAVTGGGCTTQWRCLESHNVAVPNYGPGTVTVTPSQTTTYTYTCTNPNGTTVAKATVTVASAKPDLIASAVTPTTVTAGTATTLSATIKNQGGASTGRTFDTLFEIDNDSTHTTLAQVDVLKTDSNSTLGAGGSESSTLSYTFPSAGTWYVRACADQNTSGVGVVTESNESNNCGPVSSGAWTVVTVKPVPAAAPTVSCGVSPATGTTGTTYTWSTAVDGGTAPYTYTWSGTQLTGKTDASVAVTYPAPGTYTGSVQVTDSKGLSSDVTACTGGSETGDAASATVASSGTLSINSFQPTSDTQDITCGSQAKLTWSSTAATSCTGTGFSTGGSANNASGVAVTPADAPQSNYQISCTDGTNTVYANTSVNVASPEANIAVSPVRVAGGGPVTVTWSATDVKSCVVTKNGTTIASGNADASGNYTNSASPYADHVSAQSAYVITCTLPAGAPASCTDGTSASASATANIIPDIQNF